MNKLVEIINHRLGGNLIDSVVIGQQTEEGMYKMHVGHHYLATLVFRDNQVRLSTQKKAPIVFDMDDPAFDPETLVEMIVNLRDEFEKVISRCHYEKTSANTPCSNLTPQEA